MHRRVFVALLGLAALASTPLPAFAADVQWIWTNEGDPQKEAPAGSRFFRRTFTANDRAIANPVLEASLEITADDGYRVWINGTFVGEGKDWHTVQRYDVRPLLNAGRNVLAVEGINANGPAGLLVKLTVTPNGRPRQAILSDASWKSARQAPEGWQKLEFDDSKWAPVKVLGVHGRTAPWQGLAWGQGLRNRFNVPEGFRVENVAINPKAGDPFSLVNMTFDDRGRLLASQEGGPILLCTDPDSEGVFRTVRPFCDLVKNCHGMCWYKDSLLLVGNGPQGTGLYRCTRTGSADKIDKVERLIEFRGGMGEHGPHAVRVGPDGAIYVICGNHAGVKVPHLAANSPLTRWPSGDEGPDQGKPGSTEDVLLPRLNDARGHAANIRAPGGTVWRCNPDGSNLALVAAGFRNQFDIAFNPAGELFTFDSDMEWDEGLPWYRAVRICHCTPGADFLWRTGAANTPNYYLDSLPPLYETGRGSPVGLEFYDHHRFGKEYRGCYFMADWSIGVIWAVFLERDGATYKARKVEKFCQGAPMNVTDLEVGPDGALYFVVGGRGTQGGVFRIVRDEGAAPEAPFPTDPARMDAWTVDLIEQPLSAWSRTEVLALPPERINVFLRVAGDIHAEPATRVRALTLLQLESAPVAGFDALLLRLAGDPSAEVRAQAILSLGAHGGPEVRGPLVTALADADPVVRRRACEALIRVGFEPPVESLWPLLGDKDQFLRTAARLVLQRMDPERWTPRLWRETDVHIVREGIVALCKTGQAARYAPAILNRLASGMPPTGAQEKLDHVRLLQLVLFHIPEISDQARGLIRPCYQAFPDADPRVNRELANLLAGAQLRGLTDQPVQGKIVADLKASTDRAQQIHYFYTLRLLRDGWTEQDKADLLIWFDGTRTWNGGNSYVPFLENILRDFSRALTTQDLARLVKQGERYPFVTGIILRIFNDTAGNPLSPAGAAAALWTPRTPLGNVALLRVASDPQLPPPLMLADLYTRLNRSGSTDKAVVDLKGSIITTLGKRSNAQMQAALRTIADNDPTQRELVARSLASTPTAENFPYLLAGLASTNKIVLVDVLQALEKTPTKPKADDPAPIRAVLLAIPRLDEKQRWRAVLLLRQWTGKKFGAPEGDWKTEVSSWSRYYAQVFPKEPPLPDVAGTRPTMSKYKFDELLTYLEGDGKKVGDATRGRAVFEKAQCARCHKYGGLGEGVGPELSAISKRFKRRDTLEAIVYPSKEISDQYRSTTFETKKGVTIFGLASAPQNGVVTVLQPDGTKVTLKVTEIADQYLSLVSVMPEQLLDRLEMNEIADLFAFLESDPGAVGPAKGEPGK